MVIGESSARSEGIQGIQDTLWAAYLLRGVRWNNKPPSLSSGSTRLVSEVSNMPMQFALSGEGFVWPASEGFKEHIGLPSAAEDHEKSNYCDRENQHNWRGSQLEIPLIVSLVFFSQYFVLLLLHSCYFCFSAAIFALQTSIHWLLHGHPLFR